MNKKNIPKKRSKNSKDNKIEAQKIIKRTRVLNIGLALAILIIVSSTVTMFYVNSVNLDNIPVLFSSVFDLNKKIVQEEPVPAAIVNQEIIDMQELNERYELIPDEYKSLIPKEEVLLQIIDEKLLLQEADKQGFNYSEEELNQKIQVLLDENLLSMEELEQSLAADGVTLDELMKFYEKEIVLSKLLDSAVFSKIEVTDTDIKDYYFKNQEQMTIPASANVSHILVCHDMSERCISNLTKDEAKERINKVREITTTDNFPQVAEEYSDEPGAELTKGNIGWITNQDPFDNNFLEETFKLNGGDISDPVETIFGYHIIGVFEKREEQVIELDAVYNQINQSLFIEQQSNAYEEYISALREKSEIINYLEKN